MKLRIHNATWQKRILLTNAVLFFSRHLKGFRKKRLHVTLTLTPRLQVRHKCRGMAVQDTPHSYSICLASELGPLAMVRCLAHEMIHLSQWLTGKMIDLDDSRSRVQWMRRTYSYRLAYRKHPWEIEAYKYDQAVARKFLDLWKREVS